MPSTLADPPDAIPPPVYDENHRLQLIHEARRGDERSFDELFHSVKGMAVGIARRHLPTSEVDDCLQEMRLRLWQKLDLYEGDGSRFPRWTHVMFCRVAIDYLRAYRRLRRPLPAHELVRRPKQPDEILIDAEHRTIAAQLVRRIPSATQRRAVEAFHLAGDTLHEFAAATNIAPHTAKVQIHRGRETVAMLARRHSVSA